MNQFLLIAGMAIVTFATRYPVLALANRFTMPAAVQRALKFIPPAVLTAIIVPAVLLRDSNAPDFRPGNIFLVAGLVATAVAWRTENLLLTIVSGMGTLWLCMWLV